MTSTDDDELIKKLINAALDTALDELDSDNDDDDEETFTDCVRHEHEIHHDSNHSHPSSDNDTIHPTNSKPVMGPPKPPNLTQQVLDTDDSNTTTNMDQLFTTMMQQLMRDTTGQRSSDVMDEITANVLPNMNVDDEFLGRFMQEMQSRLQSELSSQSASMPTASSNSSKRTTDSEPLRKQPASKQTPNSTTTTNSREMNDPSVVVTPSKSPPRKSTSTPPPPESYKETTTTSSHSDDVESVISNLVNNLSQTMQKGSNMDDDDDVDISEMNDLPPDIDDDVLQTLLSNLMTTMKSIDNINNNNDKNMDHTDRDSGAMSSVRAADANIDVSASDTIIDGMMEQLLCKDIMYEPMKQVATKFPVWLQAQQTILSSTEYERRHQQNEWFQKIVTTYETEPVDMKQLIGFMQQVQEYGPPPSEIIQDIAPGIELDDNGVPQMNNTTTTTANPMSLPPIFGANNNEECRIM